ncbi:hypothetical protein Tco_1467819 [Tanacetum coccineum]
MSNILAFDEEISCVSANEKERHVSLALGHNYLRGLEERDHARVLCFPIGGGDYAMLEYYSSPSVSLTMSEEDQTADVAALPKFDMPSYESSMTAKDIKSLAVRHDIPLDLHLVALTKGWTMDVNDPALGDGFSVSDVQTLTERVIDLRYQGECASIEKGTALTDQDQSAQHTTPPLPANQTIPDKNDHQKEVKVEDPKIVAIRKRKARAAAKKRENKKRGADEGEGSHPKDRSLHVPPHDSTNRFVHNYTEAHDDEETNSLWLGSLVDHSRRNLTLVQTEVFQSSSGNHSIHPSPTVERTTTPTRSPCEVLMSRKTNILEWFEHLQANFDKLAETHSECEETVRKLVQARVDLEHNSMLYNDMNVRYRRVKDKHDGYTEKLRVLEDQNSELSWVNKDQALKIKELDDVLAKNDSALVYAERINVERAQEKEKLVAQLSQTEMDKFDCTRKLLPTVVYLEPPPSGQAPSTIVGDPTKPSSRKTPGSSAPPKP